MNSRTARRTALLAGLLAVLALAAQYRDGLLGRHWLAGDNAFQNYPWHVWLATHPGPTKYLPVAAMSLGYPLWAEPQVGLAYPLNTALWPGLEPLTGFTLKLLLHVAIGAVGMAWLARREGLGPVGAAAAALSFGAGGFVVHRIVHTPLLLAAAWIPWVVAAYGRALAGGGLPWGLLTTGLAALQFLPGHPQMSLVTALLALLVGAAAQDPAVPAWRRWGRSAAGYALVIGGQLLLTATVWMPALRHAANGPRLGDTSVEFVTQWGAQWWEAGINVCAGLRIADVWEKTAFAGTLALLALLLGRALPWARQRLWSRVAALGLLLTWAVGNPLYHLVVYLPLANRLRGPSRYGVLYAVAGALLVGALVEHASRLERRAVWRGVAATAAVVLLAAAGGAWQQGPPPLRDLLLQLAVLLLAGGLLGARRPFAGSWLAPSLLLLLALELLWFGRGVNPALTRAEWAASEENVLFRAAASAAPSAGSTLFQLDRLPSNAALCWGVAQPTSFTPLALPYMDTVNVLLHRHVPPGVLRAFGVGQVITRPEAGLAQGLRPAERIAGWQRFEHPAPLRLPAYLPRSVTLLSDGTWHQLLQTRAADPTQAAVTAEPPPALPPEGVRGEVLAVPVDQADQVVVRYRAASVAQVVVTRAWAPGWRATVAGQPVPLAPCNLTLLSATVPPGEQTVEFRYAAEHDEELALSQRAAACWLLLLLGSLLLPRRRLSSPG
ncbi:MAG: hypothetical protein IT204_07425 [Fimbriimonadaceae bacterium]|nr:hypothetical protein [Fimbriimonadaceae bacterium]